MDATAALRMGVTVTRHGDKALDEVGGLVGNGERIPAQLIGWCCHRLELAREAAVVDTPEGQVHRSRTDAVQPGAAVVATRRSEGSTGQLLGVKSVWALLRRVLPNR